MSFTHLKFAVRRISRNKIYSLIILLSLSIGFACSNLLISFLIAETNTDSFHSKSKRTFQIFNDDPFGGNRRIAYITGAMPDYLKSNYPEVERVSQFTGVDRVTLETTSGKFHDVDILMADSSFFSVFDFPIYKGRASNGLTPESIMLTREKAKILFGEEDVVGRTLTLETADTSRLLTVSAVIDNLPENSHLIFEGLIHHSVLKKELSGGPSYVLLGDELAVRELEKKINLDAQIPGLIGPGKGGYHLDPLRESYFNKDNTMPFTKTRNKILIGVGYVVCGLVLFMASFNFINLFLLSLQERKKETGIRKTLGVSLTNLINASSAEVIIYLATGLISSLLLTYLLLPVFNTITEANLKFSYLAHPQVFLAIGLVIFLLGVLVILISVSKQWKTQPINLIRNNYTSKPTFNRFLFTIQFVISITLVICSITIIRQMNFLEYGPLGFNRNIIQLNSFDKESSKSFPVLKQRLLQIPGINQVTVCSGNPISGNMVIRYELENGELFTPYLFSGDDDFLKTLGFTLVQGDFLQGNEGRLVNEKLVRYFNMSHPVGEMIPGTNDRIMGVVKDFTCVSFKKEIPPVIISYSADNRNLLLDFSDHSIAQLLPSIESSWHEVFPGQPFSYHILQQDLATRYKEDTFFYKIVISFAIASVVISCFGLFALSWAVTQSRMKEIGIRKVLGATANDIVSLLTKTFTLRIAIAFIIATPAGYFLMEKWLSNFVNRVPINAWTFALSAGVVAVIAFTTLFLQTVKAALSNPVQELRSE